MIRTALITGGARGIGRGVAESLAREGWNLALCGTRAPEDVGQAVREIAAIARENDASVKYYTCDVANTVQRQQLLADVYTDCGEVNLLVNNAGVGARVRGDLLEMTEENYEWLMRINLQGPFFLTQEVARRMIRMKSRNPALTGCVVNVSSISATVASTNRGEYCLSKAGVSMATKLWAVRLAEEGIPVYEIRPGLIRTDMTTGAVAKYDKLIAEGLVPANRWGFPEDVGRAVAMLARGDLPYSTGQVIMIDGGMQIERL